MRRSFLYHHQTNYSKRNTEKSKGSHLSVRVLVNFVIPGIIIVLNKGKILFLFSLQSGWSSVYVGREVTLGDRKSE